MAALDSCCLYVVTLSYHLLSAYGAALLLLAPGNGSRRWLPLKHCWFHSHFHTQAPGFTYTGCLSSIQDPWIWVICPPEFRSLVEDRIPSIESSFWFGNPVLTSACAFLYSSGLMVLCVSISPPLWVVRVYSQSFATWVTREVELCCMLGLWWAADL